MSTGALSDRYREMVAADPDKYMDSYKQVSQEVLESRAQYWEEPIAFLYHPMFLTDIDIERFDQVTRQLYGILNKVVTRYLEDSSFRKYFGFSQLLEELVLKNPGYVNDIPIGRFDIFYDLYDGSLQFCELNTDGSSGMQQQFELANIFRQASAIQELDKEYEFKDFELFDSWTKIVQSKYEEFSNSKEKPQIAIIDWLDGKMSSEFVAFKGAFERAGCKTVIVDPRWLEYREGKLFYQDFRIDCIYRRAVTFEVIERADSVKDLINAYLNGDVCVIGPFRSQIAHNKVLFALLHDKNKTSFLNEEDRLFIDEHIPYTVIVDINNSDLLDYARMNKDQLVLKPMDKYASMGIRFGQDYSVEEWVDIIQKEAKEEYLLQTFCKVPKMPMAFFDEEKVDFIDTSYSLGLFMYDGIFQGIYTRVGTKINIGGHDCFKIPNFVVNFKN